MDKKVKTVMGVKLPRGAIQPVRFKKVGDKHMVRATTRGQKPIKLYAEDGQWIAKQPGSTKTVEGKNAAKVFDQAVQKFWH